MGLGRLIRPNGFMSNDFMSTDLMSFGVAPLHSNHSLQLLSFNTYNGKNKVILKQQVKMIVKQFENAQGPDCW